MPYKPSVDELGPGQYLVTVVNGGDDLPEEVPGVSLAEPLPLAHVVIQVATAGILHDDHNLAAVLKHWGRGGGTSGPPECTAPLPARPLPGPGPDTSLQGCLLMGREKRL